MVLCDRCINVFSSSVVTVSARVRETVISSVLSRYDCLTDGYLDPTRGSRQGHTRLGHSMSAVLTTCCAAPAPHRDLPSIESTTSVRWAQGEGAAPEHTVRLYPKKVGWMRDHGYNGTE